MSNISIKDVPDQWAEALRQRAARNHRSLQGELMAIIERAVREGQVAEPALQPLSGGVAKSTAAGHGAEGHSSIRRGWKTVDQIAAELRAKYPVPFSEGPLGVDIIREERDSR